jgi:hypothetical protein
MPEILPVAAQFSEEDSRFLRGVTRGLIEPAAYEAVHVDVVVNLERMMARTNPHHRTSVLKLVRCCRRISFLYGGPEMPARAGHSRFVTIQKLGRALSCLCLVAFWADAAALALIDRPESLP